MLVITRNKNQTIQIGDDIVVTLVHTRGQQAKIAIEAPEHINIVRGELLSEAQTCIGQTD